MVCINWGKNLNDFPLIACDKFVPIIKLIGIYIEVVTLSTVLIVDDSETVRTQLRRTFEEGEFNVLEAENGRVGLDVLKKNASIIDVILCDVNMPEMDGIALLKSFKGSPGAAGSS